MDVKKEMEAMVREGANRLGVEISRDLKGAVDHAAEKAQQLSLAVGESGFNDAVSAAADSVALRAGISLSQRNRAANRELVGIITGGIRILAVAAL